MKDFQEEALEDVRSELVKKLKMDGLLTQMRALKMLDKRECEKILSKSTQSEQVEFLLDFLSTRGDDSDEAFDNFLKALEHNNDRAVANRLRAAAENASQDATSGNGDRSEEGKDEDPAPSDSKKKKVTDTELSMKRYEWSEDHADLFVLFNQFTEERKGTEIDEKSLKEFFEDELNFDYHSYEDCSKHKFKQNLDKLAKHIKRSKQTYHSLVVAILSHGDENGINTCANANKPERDSKGLVYITLDEIFQAMKVNGIWTTFKDRPKVFIVQACQGGKDQKAVDKVGGGSEAVVDMFRKLGTPSDADILISYSTTEGYYANRDPETGTQFIQEMVKILRHFYELEQHLVDMITCLQDKIADQVYGKDKDGKVNKQMPYMVSTLTKQLTFHKNK